jgi:hypothetical protein
MAKTFPRSLAGRFQISKQMLKPIKLIDTKANDYKLEEIRFGTDRIGRAIFESGVQFSFPVKWDWISDSYSFIYNEVPHIFSAKTDLGKICRFVDVMSLTPIGEFGD